MRDPKLDDVMSSAQKSSVHGSSLEEAGVIPEKVEPVPLRTRVRQVITLVLVLAIAVGGWFWLSSYWAQSQQQQALQRALASVEPKTKLRPLETAAIYLAAAEFYLRAQEVDKAQKHFRMAARAPFSEDKDSAALTVERDAFLIDLLLHWIDLGGTEAEDLDKVKIEWKIVLDDLGTTLQKISTTAARQTALRAVAAKLMERDKLDLALALAARMGGSVGQGPGEAEGEDGPLAAQHVALLLKANKTDEARAIAPEPKPGPPPNLLARQGHAEGAAWKGDFAKAMQVIKLPEDKGESLQRLQAALGVAAIALFTKKVNEAQEPLIFAQERLGEMEKNLAKDKLATPIPGWEMLQLAQLLAQVGKTEESKAVIAKMTDKSAVSRALLELLRERVAAAKEQVPMTAVDDFAIKDSLSYAQALLALARHNTRLGPARFGRRGSCRRGVGGTIQAVSLRWSGAGIAGRAKIGTLHGEK